MTDVTSFGQEAQEAQTVQWQGGRYTREDLLKMEPTLLRALFRERVHHTIEVPVYPIVLGEREPSPTLGLQPQLIYEVWKERGFSDDAPDFEWGRGYLALAAKLRRGEKVRIGEPVPEPFTEMEMAGLKKAIWERRSCRYWQEREVPDEMITQILEAGRAAPNACNLNVVRFVVLREPEELKMVWSDVPTLPNRCVIIVICYDSRVYRVVGNDRHMAHNQLLDCGAAADHMLLMAHALGLGAVWLSETKKTATAFKEQYGLPDYIEPVLHLGVGWPATGSIKSQRAPLAEMLITNRPGP